MQDPFSLTTSTMQAVTHVLTPHRLGRYLAAANGDQHLALRLYIWNARLCEAFYLPCQMAEVACRNAIARALTEHYGMHWHNDEHFRSVLPKRLRCELENAVLLSQQHRGGSADRVAGALTFGFWVHLLTKGFDFILWKSGMSGCFPNAPSGIARGDIHRRVDRVRMFRNRIAHHDAVFDRQPTSEHGNIVQTVGFVCPETQWLLVRLSRVPRTINARPRI